MTRAAMRQALRDAAVVAFPGHKVARRWGQVIDKDALPGVGFFTPRFQKVRDGSNAYSRTTDIACLIKRNGGADLEDLLDADTGIAEAMVLATLKGQVEDIELDSADFDIPGSGETRIGQVTLTFRALQLT